jgi:hypothetical protein
MASDQQEHCGLRWTTANLGGHKTGVHVCVKPSDPSHDLHHLCQCGVAYPPHPHQNTDNP